MLRGKTMVRDSGRTPREHGGLMNDSSIKQGRDIEEASKPEVGVKKGFPMAFRGGMALLTH